MTNKIQDMRIVWKSLSIAIVGILVVSSLCSSCGKKANIEIYDTTRGIWGNAFLYNELGVKESDHSDISIKVHCIDTLDVNSNSIFDTTYYIPTDANGAWELYKPRGGWYFLEFSKKDYCKNAIYAHYYDTSHADTVENVYLTKRSQGSVEIDSLQIKDNVLTVYRTLYFTGSYASYSLSTWYFFGRSESVSPDDYVYAYVSGSSSGAGNSKQSMAVYKSLDKLLELGFQEGEKVYVRAYCDNARAVSYQSGEKTWEYPNILEGSNVMSFEIPESEDEEE